MRPPSKPVPPISASCTSCSESARNSRKKCPGEDAGAAVDAAARIEIRRRNDPASARNGVMRGIMMMQLNADERNGVSVWRKFSSYEIKLTILLPDSLGNNNVEESSGQVLFLSIMLRARYPAQREIKKS